MSKPVILKPFQSPQNSITTSPVTLHPQQSLQSHISQTTTPQSWHQLPYISTSHPKALSVNLQSQSHVSSYYAAKPVISEPRQASCNRPVMSSIILHLLIINATNYQCHQLLQSPTSYSTTPQSCQQSVQSAAAPRLPPPPPGTHKSRAAVQSIAWRR